jgi:DegV family protein with EDD domain
MGSPESTSDLTRLRGADVEGAHGMQIVTDSGVDLTLTPGEQRELNIRVVPLVVSLEGKSYREGLDITPDEFYEKLSATNALPTTSQPSPGDFAVVYRELAASDPSILSIHMSSGLSGTLNSARTAAASVPGAKVTIVDTKTLSVGAGLQVEAAARALRAGWPLDAVLAMVHRLQQASHTLFTLRELKYLIHGGRISHMKGLIASVLDIKPLIGVENERGTYEQMGQQRTFSAALRGLAELLVKWIPRGSAVRAQVAHARNPQAAQELVQNVSRVFECTWRATARLSLVLGAHTGPSMVGVVVTPQSAFADLP